MHYYASDKLGFEFRGSAREWFGIWIVNLLLSIVTLGIYSAWAKVRTKRYFNGNTKLAGHSFDYHANPVAILKGRIIVVVVLVVLNLLSQINPLLAIGVLVFYAIALPWVIVIALAGLLAHFCLTKALSLAPAAVVMPVDFARLPIIALVGLWLYGESLEPLVLVGAAIIFAANYVLIRHEHRQSRAT